MNEEKTAAEGLSERQLLLRIDRKLDRVTSDLGEVKRQAAVAGGVAGGIAGGVAGGVVAVAIGYIKAKMGW